LKGNRANTEKEKKINSHLHFKLKEALCGDKPEKKLNRNFMTKKKTHIRSLARSLNHAFLFIFIKENSIHKK
jgi:hypothetical protein